MMSARYESQSILFSHRPSRRAVLGVKISGESRRTARVNVWRNHAFESLIPLMEPYCRFGGWCADFRLAAYDDSLMFNNWRQADLELLWLDSSRFPMDSGFHDWLAWLSGRLRALRILSKVPVVLATWMLDQEKSDQLQESIDRFPGVYFADLQRICEESSIQLLDQRTAGLAGTPVSNSAQLILARELACHSIPAALFPPIKAVAVDLDNTLHDGVLGEDGIDGVVLTQAHQALQRYIKTLQGRGVFIALVSRNERPDVEALFARRDDYPLRWEDFSAIEVSWGDKAAAVDRIAKALRIAPEAVLFVDDNPGELAGVALQLPEVHTVYAHTDANLTLQVMHYYPGLWRWKVESDDTTRIQDMKASVERAALAGSAADSAAYFRSLRVALTYRYNPRGQISRIADLCAKTNQFNLALRRFNQAEVAERLNRDDACVVSVQLGDRLSDSGVIAVLVAERDGDQVVVVELCISCRAMGRQLESTIILAALRDMPILAGCRAVAFRVQQGPRNQPALDWLAGLLGLPAMPVSGIYSLPSQRLFEFAAADGVTLIKE